MRIEVALKGGKTESVECFGKFTYEIDGQKFKLAVTEQVAGLGKVVTHLASGLKVCAVSVGAAYLPAFAKKMSDIERAKVSLEQLIERVGAAKVRSVIAAAEAGPAVHYWTGRGTLCSLENSTTQAANHTADVAQVTCPHCKTIFEINSAAVA